MNGSSFNMAQTVSVLQRHLKTILLFTIITMAVATIVVFLMPRYYRSTAKLIAANPQLADKSRLFNDRIQGLYSYFGSGDDLDRIIGIADLDTTYKQLVDEFKLVDYYQLGKDSLPLLKRKAVLKLKDDLSFQRTEQEQLKIICWTKDNQLSADLANRLIVIVQKQLEAIWLNNYVTAQQQLQQSVAEAESEYKILFDSAAKSGVVATALITRHMNDLLTQLSQYRKTAASFKLMGETAPQALFVLEQAVPAVKAERPDKLAVILVSGLAGFVFIVLLLLLNHRKQQ